MVNKIAELYKKHKEIIMYIIFGGATTLVNWIVYFITVMVFRSALNNGEVGSQIITICNAIAWFVAVLFAFVTNKVYVFESRSWKLSVMGKELVLFFGARAFSGVFEIFVPGILVSIGFDQKIFGIEGFAAKILVSVLVVILNYILGKWMVFRKKSNPDQEEQK